MPDNELAFATALELRDLIAQKRVSPVELTELFLGRIDNLDGRLNAFITVTGDAALDAAREAETTVTRGDELGPLHGVPMAVKDLDMTRGVRTTSGSLVFKDNVPTENAINVEWMMSAGAIMLGKTNTPEFGFLGATENRLGDPCGNPWNPERTTGGSSGGSAAAVASGMVPIGTGGDGGGSIRIPASFCGIYGIKATQGRVPLYQSPALPPLPNQLGQLGGLTRTVADSALVLQIVSGRDSRDPVVSRVPPPDFTATVARGVKGLRIAWSPDYGYAAVDPEVVRVAEKGARLFEELGCTVEETDFTLVEPFERAFWPIFSANGYAAHRSLLENRRDDLTWYVRECLEYGSTVTGEQYALALGYIDRLKGQLADLLEKYDLLLSPTMAIPAFPHGDPPKRIAGRDVNPYWDFLPFTFPINMAGHPAASVPCGFSADEMPIGLHLVGRRWDEETVLAASGAFEKAQPWAHLRPPVS